MLLPALSVDLIVVAAGVVRCGAVAVGDVFPSGLFEGAVVPV